MNQKQIGIALLAVGILLVVILIASMVKEDYYIKKLTEENNGSCILEDGYCLHEDRSYTLYIYGGIISISLIILGLYLVFFDKTQQTLAAGQQQLASALAESTKKNEFQAFLAGFTEEEQSILKAVHDQDGIQQSTLRYKTGLSKTTLSLMLKSLEQRTIISRTVDGKTNKVFLRK